MKHLFVNHDLYLASGASPMPRAGKNLTTRAFTYIRSCCFVLVTMVLVAVAGDGSAAPAGQKRQIILSPEIIYDDEGSRIVSERGLMLAPENRAKANSRKITIHFQRFPPINPIEERPPVFLLLGGPGFEYNFNDQRWIDFLNSLRQTWEVVVVSQRGNPSSPGLVPKFRIQFPDALPLDQPASVKAISQRNAVAYENALSNWREAGVDIEGYDILHFTDDVNDLRISLGYDQIVLRGCSFGSQWGFGYLKRWPQTVERAMLSGVEPLDYAYDSAEWLWSAMGRVAAQAEADPELSPSIPTDGLLAALETVIQRLEQNPAAVTVIDPTTKAEVRVVVGADDLRLGAIRSFRAFGQDNDAANLALWPHFILDMYEGDYRALGLMSLVSRQSKSGPNLIVPLTDNSLGISKKRDEKLLNEHERRWIDPNWLYRATRSVSGAPEISDEFRDDWSISVPTLLVSGDFDWSTPIENAEHAENFLERGKLITVKGATHCTLNKPEQVRAQAPDIFSNLHQFIDGEFENNTVLNAYFESLPDSIALRPVDFQERGEFTVYDVMLQQR